MHSTMYAWRVPAAVAVLFALGVAPLTDTKPPPPPGAWVQWQAPASCPQVEVVYDAVARLLGRALVERDRTQVSAQARIEQRADGIFALELEVRSAGGTRSRGMLGRRCATLADAVALEVATALDPMAVVDGLAGDAVLPSTRSKPRTVALDTGTSAAGPELPGEADPSSEAKPTSESEQALRIAVSLGPVAGLGMVGAVLAGGDLGVALLGRHARAELGASYWPRARLRYAPAPQAGMNLAFVMGRLRGCATARLSSLEFPVCAGAEFGAVRARGVGVSRGSVAWAPWIAATAGAGVIWPVARRVALAVDMGLAIPLWRPAFTVRNLPLKYRLPTVAGRAGLRVEVRLP